MMFPNLILFFHLINTASAGCPAIRIDQASFELKSCVEQKVKPLGALITGKMISPSEKDLKVFLPAGDCKKFVGRDFCLDLNQWCIMVGNPPHGASHVVDHYSVGKCVSKAN